jgi:nucleotidyltransferase substrate binding protein (TIGR01987 family)
MTKLQSLIKNLKKANQKLKEAVSLEPTRIHKDAVLQRFEFTFELAWKTIQEYIKDQGFDCKSPKSCIREGARLELLKNPEDWFDYLKARNLISHTYNERLADKIYQKAKKFPKEVEELLKELI